MLFVCFCFFFVCLSFFGCSVFPLFLPGKETQGNTDGISDSFLWGLCSVPGSAGLSLEFCISLVPVFGMIWIKNSKNLRPVSLSAAFKSRWENSTMGCIVEISDLCWWRCWQSHLWPAGVQKQVSYCCVVVFWWELPCWREEWESMGRIWELAISSQTDLCHNLKLSNLVRLFYICFSKWLFSHVFLVWLWAKLSRWFRFFFSVV